jgi:hypothetical protein
MAILLHPASGRRSHLRARTVVGRSRTTDLVIDQPAVSGEHARIVWVDGAWHLRDLGSRNGTWLDDTRLDPGRDHALQPGAILHFGVPTDPWLLEDAAPPTVFARPEHGGAERVMAGGLLALPSDTHPVATLFHRPATAEEGDAWVLELPDATREVVDRDVVVIEDVAWQFFLPGSAQGTIDARAQPAEALRFTVSLDQEHIELWLERGGQAVSLGARSHNEVLLVLARRRLAEPDLPEGERGWMYRDELCSALRVDLPQLNLLVFRARKALDGTSSTLGAGLIERRLRTGQLRIGVSRLRVDQAS